MKKFSNLLSNTPLFIGFICCYPVLFLWWANIGQIESYAVPRSMLISAIFTLSVTAFFCIWIRPIRKAFIIASIFLTAFYFYGQIFSLVDNRFIFNFMVGRHRFIIPVFILIFSTLTFLVLRAKGSLKNIFKMMNIFWGILFALVSLQFVTSLIQNHQLAKSRTILASDVSNQASMIKNYTPDVYFILLDGYSRSDLLMDEGYDNREFLYQLESRGFNIPDCGQSNYSKTAFSLASTLNMDYLENLGISINDLSYPKYETLLEPVISNSVVRKNFQELGYTFMTNKVVFRFINISDADYYFDFETTKNPSEKLETLKFQQLFIDSTFLRTITEWINKNPNFSTNIPFPIMMVISPMSANPDSGAFMGMNYKDYLQNIYQLDNLEKIADIPGKKFLYSHLMVTHKPFVFLENGEFDSTDQISYKAYLNQITYANSRILKMVDIILKKSKNPPIIILQSDHSYTKAETYTTRNFQAYYLPGIKENKIDPYFTNVNIFRLVFREYFGMDIPLLPNRSEEINVLNPTKDHRIVEASCQNFKAR